MKRKKKTDKDNLTVYFSSIEFVWVFFGFVKNFPGNLVTQNMSAIEKKKLMYTKFSIFVYLEPNECERKKYCVLFSQKEKPNIEEQTKTGEKVMQPQVSLLFKLEIKNKAVATKPTFNKYKTLAKVAFQNETK